MSERFTIDSNILVYAVDLREPAKQLLAEEVIARAARLDCVLTALSLAEFYVASVRKVLAPPGAALKKMQDYAALFPTCEYSTRHVLVAAEAAAAGRFGLWDALILASAADAGCTVCLSDDMKDGAKLGSIIVRNPFGPKGLSKAASELLAG